jgi:hypothetical protein
MTAAVSILLSSSEEPDMEICLVALETGDLTFEYLRKGGVYMSKSHFALLNPSKDGHTHVDLLIKVHPELIPLIEQDLNAGMIRAGVSAHRRLTVLAGFLNVVARRTLNDPEAQIA